MYITIRTGATAATTAPSAATDGVALRGGKVRVDKQLRDGENEAMIAIHSTAGSGTMTVTAVVWGYHADLGKWFKIADLNKDSAGAAQAIAETGTDLINYAERVVGLRHFDRIDVQITAIAGTATAVTCSLLSRSGPGKQG